MRAKPVEEVELLVAESAAARVGVDAATGWIRSLVWKRRGSAPQVSALTGGGGAEVDLFAQTRRPIEGYIGGIRVFDEARRLWHDDFAGAFEIEWIEKTGRRLVFDKRFRDDRGASPFTARVELSLEGDRLSWDVELRQGEGAGPLLSGAPSPAGASGNRQVKVALFLPLVAGWKVWAPAAGTPFVFDGMSSFEFMYNQGPYAGEREVMVPVVSHYHAGLDVGFTVADRFERNVPASKFQFSNGSRHFNWSQYFPVPHWEDYPYLEVVHSHIGMRGAGACRTGVHVFLHEGDWRPGMGRVVEHYKEFFYPPVDATWDRAGVYTCNDVGICPHLDRFRALGLEYLEVHGHFPWYGEYFTGEDEWATIGELEATRAGGATGGRKFERLTREKVDARLRAIAEAGVNPYWYINFSDGYEEEVEKRWPESIARREDGGFARSGWRHCHLMNPDPSLPFGRHIIENAKGALECYGSLKGFFLDCFRHFEFDFAHDDGVTLANGKPAYSISWGLGKLQAEVSRLLRERGLDCFANKPRTISTMRWVDGMLLEAQGDAAEMKWFWTCVAKPMYYLWGALEKPEEEYLKRCVALGAWPRTPSGNWLEDDREFAFQKKLYDAYRPLYAHFMRRVVCFEPDPLHPSDGLYGELFMLPDGSYAAGLMTDWTSVFDDVRRRAVAPYVAFRLRSADALGDVSVHLAGEGEPRRAGYYRTPPEDGKPGLLVVDMPDFRTAAVVRLAPGDASRCVGVRKLRDTRDYCGDPTSAFEFGSGAGE